MKDRGWSEILKSILRSIRLHPKYLYNCFSLGLEISRKASR